MCSLWTSGYMIPLPGSLHGNLIIDSSSLHAVSKSLSTSVLCCSSYCVRWGISGETSAKWTWNQPLFRGWWPTWMFLQYFSICLRFLVTTNTKFKILTIIFSGFESIFILLKTSMMFLAAKLMYFHLIHSIYRPPKPSWVFFLGASTLPQYGKLPWFATTKLQRISRNEQTFPKNDLKLMTWKKIILPNHIGIIVNQYKDPYKKTRIQWKVIKFFFVARLTCVSPDVTWWHLQAEDFDWEKLEMVFVQRKRGKSQLTGNLDVFLMHTRGYMIYVYVASLVYFFV